MNVQRLMTLNVPTRKIVE